MSMKYIGMDVHKETISIRGCHPGKECSTSAANAGSHITQVAMKQIMKKAFALIESGHRTGY